MEFRAKPFSPPIGVEDRLQRGPRVINRTFILILLLSCISCSKSLPEEAIMANLKSMQQGLEDRKAGKSLEFVSEDFVGNQGLDKRSLKRIMLGQFLRHQNITVVITRMDITINPSDPYSASMEGVVAATGAQNLLPQDGRLYSVQGDWRSIDDEWMLIRLEWE